jgi:hypothetical protein
VGEETRCDPLRTDFSGWLRGRIASLPIRRPPAFPASFDRAVWPRHEDVELEPVTIPATGQSRNILELYPIGPCENPASEGDWRIAITLITRRGTIARAVDRSLAAEEKPILRNWALMGYDVVDSGLAISGLLNCGDGAVEIAEKLLSDTAMQLTQFYLWPSPAIAESYAHSLDQVAPDHAPFEVLGLYRCQR